MKKKEEIPKQTDVLFNIGEDYIDIKPLDEGGMGTLFKAYKRGLGVSVAIKRVKREIIGAVDQKGEANILKQLKHQYLPQIYDFIDGKDGFFYTVMDYIPGENLHQYVKKRGVVEQTKIHKWACQICEAVSYLHAQNPPIIHCDIKPSNVMITPSGDICLIDFNTSLLFSDDAQSIGLTKGYAAPEQYSNLKTTQFIQSDASSNKKYSKDHSQISSQIPTMYSSDNNPSELETEKSDRYENYTLPTERTPSNFSDIPTEKNTPALSGIPTEYSAKPALKQRSKEKAMEYSTAEAGKYGSITKRTDIYGIGATLYFSVSGKHPESSLKNVTPLSSLSVEISPIMLAIIQRAMEKDQQKRFDDAEQMLNALQDVITLDSRLVKYRRIERFTSIILCLSFMLSLALAVLGGRSMTNERSNKYVSMIAQGEAAISEGDYSAGEQLTRQAIEMSPEKAEAYISLGHSLYKQAKYTEAIETIESAISSGALQISRLSDSSQASLCYVLGNCHFELQEYEAAIEEFNTAVEMSDVIPSYYRGLALAQARNGNLNDAQETLELLKEKGTNSPDCIIVEAEIKSVSGDKEESLELYKSVLEMEIDSDDLSRIYIVSAQICDELDLLDEEIELLSEAVDRLPVPSVPESLLAQALSKKAKLDEKNSKKYYALAAQSLSNVIQRGHGTLLTNLNLAMMQENCEEYQDAESTLLKISKDYPKDYRVYMRLAFLYADWQKVKKTDNRDYSLVVENYEIAKELYSIAVANGTEDIEMAQLQSLVAQLEESGWID